MAMGEVVMADPPAVSTTAAAAVAERRRWRWSRDAFLRLAELGVFAADEKVELIEGDIVPMAPPNPPHSGAINPVGKLLESAFGSGFHMRTEQPLVLGEDTQPQPDVVICVGEAADYRRRFPTAEDVRLVVEVSDTTLAEDRAVKGPLYARAGIPEYWILNLRDACLEVFREPDGARYRAQRLYTAGETVAPLAAAASVDVAALLGV
jgi:Uma2 family endonuclease